MLAKDVGFVSKTKNQPTLEPHSAEAEEALIGALCVDPDAIIEVEFLEPTDFYLSRNGFVYGGIKRLYRANRPIDLVAISDELDNRDSDYFASIGGPAFLTDLINHTPTSVHAPYYARIVFRNAIARKVIETAQKSVELAYGDFDDPEELLGNVQRLFLDIDHDRIGQSGPKSVKAALDRLMDKVEARTANPELETGIKTGIKDLDNVVGSLRAGRVYVLAGRPGMGKSGLALTIARNLARKNKRTLYFSLEMPDEEVAERLAAMESGIDLFRLAQGNVYDSEWPILVQAAGQIEKMPIDIDDQPALKTSILRSRALRHQAKYGLDLIIIDHMGKARPDHPAKNDYEAISAVSDMCLMIAKELGVPVLALSQLSRAVESRHDKVPMMSDLRASGKIEEDAHAIIFIYRDEVYNRDTETPHVADLHVSKNRGGRLGQVLTYFRDTTTEFTGLEVETKNISEWGQE